MEKALHKVAVVAKTSEVGDEVIRKLCEAK